MCVRINRAPRTSTPTSSQNHRVHQKQDEHMPLIKVYKYTRAIVNEKAREATALFDLRICFSLRGSSWQIRAHSLEHTGTRGFSRLSIKKKIYIQRLRFTAPLPSVTFQLDASPLNFPAKTLNIRLGFPLIVSK